MDTTTTLITGATGGLGIAYSHEFASLGHRVVLVARREDAVNQLADDLRASHGADVVVALCDLASPASRQELYRQLGDESVDVLVNNAGFGHHSATASTDPDTLNGMVRVNCEALVELSRWALPGMIERGRGSIVNVASTAAFQPLPDMAVYAATKAFVRSFSLALAAEAEQHDIQVLTVCPGATETPFWDAADAQDVLTERRTSEQVVATTMQGLKSGKSLVIDGVANNIMARAADVMPWAIVKPVTRWMVRRRG